MLAEAFRQPGERMYIAGFGLIGLVGALVASCFLWDTDARQLRRRPRRQLRALHQHHPLHRRHPDDGVLARRGRARRAAGGRVLRADAVRDQRHDADGGGDRPAGDLPGARGAVAVGLRADRAPPRERRGRRGGVQVLPARRVLERVLPLRHRVRVHASPARRGSTSRRGDLPALAGSGPSTLALLAVGLLAVGFAFKVSAVPFHMWTPDAYEGAPTIVTAFMSTGVKAAAFAAFVRVFLSTLEPLQGQWIPVLGGDRRRDDDRSARWSAWCRPTSSGCWPIRASRHAGYLLLGIVAANSAGKAAVLFYLLAYAVTNLGALGIVALLGTAEHPHDELRDFAGLWKTRPGLAGADDGVPALARRLPADRRLHRQVVHLHRRGPGRALLRSRSSACSRASSRSSSTCASW